MNNHFELCAPDRPPSSGAFFKKTTLKLELPFDYDEYYGKQALEKNILIFNTCKSLFHLMR
jgi:hypothetical protein